MPLINPSTFSGCAPRTAQLADYFGRNVPEGRDLGQLGFLQFLQSSINLAGVRKLSDDIMGVAGKKRGVKLQYNTPMCVKVCSTAWNCLDPKSQSVLQFNLLSLISLLNTTCATLTMRLPL